MGASYTKLTAIADAAGLGTIEIKAMTDHGYSKEFAVGVTAWAIGLLRFIHAQMAAVTAAAQSLPEGSRNEALIYGVHRGSSRRT